MLQRSRVKRIYGFYTHPLPDISLLLNTPILPLLCHPLPTTAGHILRVILTLPSYLDLLINVIYRIIEDQNLIHANYITMFAVVV